jgi:hypothetical protein
MISSAKLLLLSAEQDTVIPIDVVKEVYQRAQELKKMMNLPISHFDIYREPWL